MDFVCGLIVDKSPSKYFFEKVTQLKNLLLLVLLFSQGCKNSSFQSSSIHPELDPFVDTFIREATTRGIELNEKRGDFIVQFGRMEAKKSASCKPNHTPKIITIDSLTWKFIDPAQKESLVFHELAHCLLQRPHNTEAFEFGECKSWMREDESSCYVNLQNPEWREYYLDELFSPSNVPVPYWYTSKPHLLETDDLTVAQNIKIPKFKFAYFDSIVINTSNDWIIDITGVKPQTGYSVIGLRINELDLEISFAAIGGNSNDRKIGPRMVVAYSEPRKIVLDAASEINTVKLSLQKIDNTVYIYFGNVLRCSYPVGASRMKVGAYCSFPEEYYCMNLYVL
jgi:hypothetical protein